MTPALYTWIRIHARKHWLYLLCVLAQTSLGDMLQLQANQSIHLRAIMPPAKPAASSDWLQSARGGAPARQETS